MKNSIKQYLIIIAGLFCYITAYSQSERIGFKTLDLYDYSQNLQGTNKPLPVQLSIWYPSIGDGQEMKFRDYVIRTIVGNVDVEYREFNQEYIDKKIAEFKKIPLQFGAKEKNLEQILDYPMSGKLNAKASPNKKPVIFLSGSTSGRFWAPMAEQLAKQGFVVVVIPVIRGAYDDIAMYRLAINALQREPYADVMQLGLVGYSTGALNTILFQMNNINVKAVLTIEGNENYNRYMHTLVGIDFIKHPFYNMANANVPHCAIYSARGSYGQPRPYCIDFSFYDDIPANYFLVELTNLFHEAGTGSAFFSKIEPKFLNADSTFTDYLSFQIVTDASINFFNENLKPSITSQGSALLNLPNKYGTANVNVKTFTETKVLNNGLSLFNLNLTKEALEVLNKAQSAYPNSTKIKFAIARCYLKLGKLNDGKKLLLELSKTKGLNNEITNLKKKYNINKS